MSNSIGVFYSHLLTSAKQENLPLAEVLSRARKMGYSSVQMDGTYLETCFEETLSLLAAAKLTINCVYAITRKLCQSDGSFEEDCKVMEHYLTLTREAGCTKFLAVPGFLSAEELPRGGAPYLAKRERIARVLQFTVRRASELGITVVMEDFDNLYAPFCYSRELLWFLRNVPGLRCALDTGNFLYCEEELTAVLPELLPYVSDVHCKDRSFAKTEGDTKTSIAGRTLYPSAVGDGDIAMRETVRAVIAAGYTGDFIVEQFGSLNRFTEIARSAENLRGMISAQ